METLPIEVIESIAQWLTPRDLAQCSAVSRSWYEMINQDQIWRPRCDPDFEEPLRTIPSVAAPKFEIPQAKTLPPISRWKMAFLREKHLFKNWSRENIDTFKEEDMIRSQNENPWIVDFLSDTQIIACYSAKIEILDISVTPAIVAAKTHQTVSIKRLNKLCVVGTDLFLVRKEDAVRTIRMMRREIRIRKSIEVFKVNIENKSIKLEYEHLFNESSKYLGLKGNLYLFVEDDRKELKILDLNTGRILKEDACPEEVDEKYSVSVKSVKCSPTSEFVGVLFSFKSNDSENCKTFVYSLKHLTFLPSPGITDLDCSSRISLHDHWMALDRKVIGLTIFKLSESGVHLSDEISLPTDIKLQIEFCNGYFVFVYWPTTSKEESHVRIYSPSSKNLTKPSIFPATYCYTDVYNKFIFVYDSKHSFTSRGVWKPSSHTLEKCDFSVVRFNHLPRWSRKVNRSFTNLFNKVELNQSPTCCSTLNLDDINTLRKINPTRWYLHHLW